MNTPLSILIIYLSFLEDNRSEEIIETSIKTMCDCQENLSNENPSEHININTFTLPSVNSACICPDDKNSIDVRAAAKTIQRYTGNGPNGLCENVTG
jgi:hypothetical protein